VKICTVNFNHILDDVEKEFELTDIHQAEKVVLWNDVLSFEQGVINLAGKKPVIVLQHGRKGSSRYFPPFNEQIRADKLLVWGQADKDALVEAGHPEKKIKVCGTTLFKHLKPRKKHEGINVVFSPEHWGGEVKENEKVAKILRRAARKYKWNITTKIMEDHDPSLYDNPISTKRADANHIDACADALSIADVVVGISESTFELFAQYMDIPVVIMEEWYPKSFGGDKRYADGYRRVISNGSKRAKFNNLVEAIQSQLENPLELALERSETCYLEGGTNIEDPLTAIKNEIIKT